MTWSSAPSIRCLPKETVFLFISFQSLTQTGAGGTGKIAYAVAENLHQKNYPVKLIVSSKGKFTTEFLSAPVSKLSKYYLFIFNTFVSPFLKPYRKRYLEELIFDFFCSRQIQPDQKLIFTTTPFIPRTFRKAKKLGLPIIFFSGTPEENTIAEKVSQEMNRWKIQEKDVYTYAPRLAVYNTGITLTDYVMCHSSVIEGTFKKKWPAKNQIACRGLLKPVKKSSRINSHVSSFTVVYAAHTVLLKGLQYLLKSWIDLKTEGELIILGSIDPAVQKIIDRDFTNQKTIRFVGNVNSIDEYVSRASVLVCPSLTDGGPVTVLEAMNNGVPAILTEDCGVKDFIEQGVTGWIIASADEHALADRIKWCSENPEALKAMVERARKAITNYDFPAYIEKIGLETLALQKV
jgi:glycosyltransferase involved in cell wall biosynthesis